MRIRVYVIDINAPEYGVRYDSELRFAPMSDLYPINVVANLREDYTYKKCSNFGKYEVVSDIEINEWGTEI